MASHQHYRDTLQLGAEADDGAVQEALGIR